MGQRITTRLTIPRDIAYEEGSEIYLHRQIDNIAEDLTEDYAEVKYIDYVLDDEDSDHLSYVISFEVESK